jgi:hypothetical protein
MELDFQRFLGLHVAQLYSLAETQQLHPSLHIEAQIRGRYWSAKIDDISLQPPLVTWGKFSEWKLRPFGHIMIGRPLHSPLFGHLLPYDSYVLDLQGLMAKMH